MFKELVDLGQELESRGALSPAGFYEYGQPIRWIVHVWPDRVYLEKTELNRPRPFDGRTSAIRAHPLTDEAGYALGVARQQKGIDKRADEKHRAFRALLQKLLASFQVSDPALREAIGWVMHALETGLVQQDPRYHEVESKDWVSFVPGQGPYAGQHLFEHPEILAFWRAELEERTASSERATDSSGACAVCGANRPLVRRMPKVKLVSTAPLHSLNADAFVSFHAGAGIAEHAHLGICFVCADTAARAFTHLADSDRHRRVLLYDSNSRDALTNQIALFWLKAPACIRAGEDVLDIEQLLSSLGNVLAPEQPANEAPTPALPQLARLLELPWRPEEAGLNLDEYGFYLAILSPNVGRIAVRDWITVSLAQLRENLRRFLTATSIISPWGERVSPQPIARLLQAAQATNPNLTRGLLRCAYLGESPPPGLRDAAVLRFRIPSVLQDPREGWRVQGLASALKVVVFYGKEEAHTMDRLSAQHKHSPYLCGRLLAILEEAQLRAANFNLNRTIVDRFYGAASTAPAATFGGLIRLATVAHLPEVGRDVRILLEDVLSMLDEAGGFPRVLTLPEQAEFALGFYHQRADFRSRRGKRATDQATGSDTGNQEAGHGEEEVTG